MAQQEIGPMGTRIDSSRPKFEKASFFVQGGTVDNVPGQHVSLTLGFPSKAWRETAVGWVN